MAVLDTLLEKLAEGRGSAMPELGAMLLGQLSGDRLGLADFIDDPLRLTSPPFFVPRYLAQVTLKALREEYETIDELSESIYAFLERSAPTLEPRRDKTAGFAVVPEAKIIELRQPVRREDGRWESGLVASVTSGPLRGADIDVHLDSGRNRTACFLVPSLWPHATVSAYNLVPHDGVRFTSAPETFFVVEPLRQVNATSIARSLQCSKPQLDQLRRGKGDTTLQTLKGTLVHAMFDRMLEGAHDLEGLCDSVLLQYGVQLASIVDDFFEEAAFRAEVLRHLSALRAFLDAHPNLLIDPQIELKRYSATLGIQGRIDAISLQENRMDILELKTGARIRLEDHAQLYIYRLLLSDLVRRSQRVGGKEIEITARLLSSADGAYCPLQIPTDFLQVIDARNKLVAGQYALGQVAPHLKFRYEGFNEDVCRPCPSWTRGRCKESTELFGDRPGAEETPELAYFRRYTRLVERERRASDQDLANLLDDSRIESRRRDFKTIVDARFVPGEAPFTFEFDENTSDLEEGDAVLLHSGSISSTPNYHGYVRSAGTRRMRIGIPLKNLDPKIFEEQTWIIDRFPADFTSEASHTALYDFLTSPKSSNRDLVCGVSLTGGPDRGAVAATVHTAAHATAQTPEIVRQGVPEPLDGLSLNGSQVEAIRRSTACSGFHLIWGPPGTGKTRVIPEIVRRVKGRTLVGGFTNTAVDKVLIALLAADPETRFLRMGRASDSPELASMLRDPSDYFSEDMALKRRSIQAIRAAMDSTPIVAATAHRACTMPYLRRRSFDMAIVDEAGQLTEPLTLGLILRARRFVLIGDDLQLPPVVRTAGLASSLFARLKRDAERAGSENLTLLDTQYRMHPQIMSVSNRLFYGGRLRSGVSHDDRLPPDGAPVLMVPVQGRAEGRVNEAEAETVAGLVRRYRSLGVEAGAIGVVSPFRAQVVLLRKLLQDSGVHADTVERFQGGERDIMILSFVRSRAGTFVFDERRFNVAITRARRKLILVADPELFRNSRYEWISTFIETPTTAGTN